MQQLINRLSSNPKKIFLIDGLGACLTTVFFIAILIPFQKVFGMPLGVLEICSWIAALFAVYSLFCFLFVRKNQLFLVKVIALLNSLYCFLTIFFVVYYFDQLSILGVSYFLLEISVIGALIWLESKVILNLAR